MGQRGGEDPAEKGVGGSVVLCVGVIGLPLSPDNQWLFLSLLGYPRVDLGGS
jgi:hypothetical protein